jgi:hypothetical protein
MIVFGTLLFFVFIFLKFQELYCQTCRVDSGGHYQDCDPKELQYGPPIPTGDLPQLETVPPNGTLPGSIDLPAGIPTLEQVPPTNQNKL